MGKKARNDSELFMFLQSDKGVQEEITVAALDGIDNKKKRNTNPTKTLIAYAERLKKSIEKNLSNSGLRYEYPIFKDGPLVYDDKRKCVTLEFDERSFRRNIFDTHTSFVPILFNYGWEVEKDIAPSYTRYKIGYGTIPTFQYYSGSYFITNAVNDFNAKYAGKNLYAHFLYGDTNLTLYMGNGKLPYMR